MRVVADSQLLEVQPGDTTVLTLEVVNTDDVIDGVSAHIIGIPDDYVSANPAMLPLFPDAAGRVTLDLAVPVSHPAGRHPLTVQVMSHGTANAPSYIDVDLDVAARPGLRIQVRPRVARARRQGRFVLELANQGNVALDVELTARDPDRQVQATFTPPRRLVEPGTVAPIMVTVRGPRMFTGAEVDRLVVIDATARPATGFTSAPAAVPGAGAPIRPDDTQVIRPIRADEPKPEEADAVAEVLVIRETSVQLRQRPFISRGLLTVLILVAIVGVWAAIFLFGLGKVFAGDPMTKQAPASFFASLNSPANGSGAGSGAAGGGAGGSGSGGDSAGGAPAGALSKSGQLPPGTGGEISGKVLATNDQQPVGRILVQAYRMGRTGLVQMSSAASQADGTYALAGLFPTDYYIEFSASGYKTQWYPNRPSQKTAEKVSAVAQGSTTNINAGIVGNPATISGKIDPGDTLTPVKTKVTARPLLGTKTGTAIATATTNGAGTYTLKNLPAPSSYELTFTTKGYQSSTLVDTVAGGDQRLEPTVVLGASTGQISGVVTDGTAPLGGATVSTTVGGSPLSVITPTTGQVGAFVLGNMPTPATYVLTISSPGHGTTTRIVDLTAGQSHSGLDVSLASGTGSISGRVVGPNGHGLGGATLTVGGAVTGTGGAPTATSLTAGSPGSFSINGLAAPGSYTLTVTAPGYAAASVPVTLSQNGAAPNITVRMANRLGKISGTVVNAAAPHKGFSGATITATNGRQSWTATSDSNDGGYLISGLAPGSYSVTVTAAGERQRTALVTVTAGQTSSQKFELAS